ncbi:17633_t:CDS:2, partial [Racocetra fulgida]
KGWTKKNRNMAESVEYAASSPAIIDEITTEEGIKNCVGYKADANETSLVGEISVSNTTKTLESASSPNISKTSTQLPVIPKTEKPEVENKNMPEAPVRITAIAGLPRPQKLTKDQQEIQNSIDTSLISNKRSRDPAQPEELKKELA